MWQIRNSAGAPLKTDAEDRSVADALVGRRTAWTVKAIVLPFPAGVGSALVSRRMRTRERVLVCEGGCYRRWSSPMAIASARALRLDPAERATLFALARLELPLPDGFETAAGEDGDDGRALLVSVVEGLHPMPAYLLGPMTRILAWNSAASALFGSPDHLSPEHRSLLWMLLVDPGEARTNPGREGTARSMVARFRSEYARHAGEPRLRAVRHRARRAQPVVCAVVG
jgi:hypothetical protein